MKTIVIGKATAPTIKYNNGKIVYANAKTIVVEDELKKEHTYSTDDILLVVQI